LDLQCLLYHVKVLNSLFLLLQLLLQPTNRL